MANGNQYGIIRNLHFWAIILIIIVLSLSYYERQIFHNQILILWYLEYFELTHNFIGSLFIIPLVYAFIAFGLRGILFTWIISFCIIFPKITDVAFNNAFVVNNVFLLFTPLMVGIFFSLELRWRKKERKTLAERDAERQSYMSQIITAQEAERQRIARELHDDTIQMLYVIANQARNITREEEPVSTNQMKKEIEGVKDAVIQVAEDVRRIMADLRPSILDDMSLSSALKGLIDRLNLNEDVHIDISVIGNEPKIKSQTDVIIYRIVQEALNNAIQHSFAKNISVSLEFRNETCQIKIQDDGVGFILPERMGSLAEQNKFGLIGMQQRIKSLGGRLDIASEIGKGTVISLEMIL